VQDSCTGRLIVVSDHVSLLVCMHESLCDMRVLILQTVGFDHVKHFVITDVCDAVTCIICGVAPSSCRLVASSPACTLLLLMMLSGSFFFLRDMVSAQCCGIVDSVFCFVFVFQSARPGGQAYRVKMRTMNQMKHPPPFVCLNAGMPTRLTLHSIDRSAILQIPD
jgi:hypothetical protein